jgi:hypothetical protein
MELAPFSEHPDIIQIHLIPAVSRDSGIENCPYMGVEKDTCFQMEGYWGPDPEESYPGYCGTHEPELFRNAVRCHFPPGEIELKVMLLNTAIYGGRGDPVEQMAYTTHYFGGDFVDLAAHEIGHAMAGLADEYQDNKPFKGQKPLFKNIAWLQHIRASSVPWLHLAERRERDLQGNLKWTHPYRGKKTDDCVRDKEIPPNLEDKFGLFWGAMYIDDVDDAKCKGYAYGDPRGADYYRPQAHCKMRKLEADFCRVCAYEISQVILRAAGER